MHPWADHQVLKTAPRAPSPANSQRTAEENVVPGAEMKGRHIDAVVCVGDA
jgi:hypothetical protein